MTSYIYSLILMPVFALRIWRTKAKQRRLDRQAILNRQDKERTHVGEIASSICDIRKYLDGLKRPIDTLNCWLLERMAEEIGSGRSAESSDFGDASRHYWDLIPAINEILDQSWSFGDENQLYWFISDLFSELDRWRVHDNNFSSDAVIPEHIFCDLVFMRSKLLYACLRLLRYLEARGDVRVS